jgi:hypothetical protein
MKLEEKKQIKKLLKNPKDIQKDQDEHTWVANMVGLVFIYLSFFIRSGGPVVRLFFFWKKLIVVCHLKVNNMCPWVLNLWLHIMLIIKLWHEVKKIHIKW